MEEQSAGGSQELKKDRSHAQGADSSAAAPGASVQTSAQVNGQPSHGESGAQPNGVPAVNGDVATTNGEHVDTIMALAGSNDPPGIDQSWRDTEANKPLGKMIDRLAQQCYLDLNQALLKMSEQDGAADGVPKANGLLPQGQLDTSEVSLSKKRHLMDFAHDQRDRFTKTLVLSDWSRNAEEMARFIDIKVWQEKQRHSYTSAANAIAETKLKSIDFKVPAPNIDGAMELLATSKASWVPDMGHIPPKRMTAKQLLKTLRNMNVLLSTRLNLHEELPLHMQDFTIADGRATFTVPGEFEVDLAIANEENTSPFYFIDIRFLFSPSSKILNDQLRSHLEGLTNTALATKGLQGCYDFLHNFVLTHKINILRSQGADLIRGKWFDCIKVENLRRSLVVQYWASMPGPKSWFEIGISSGKMQRASAAARRKATPRLSVRGFRKGQEVKDEMLDFDWETLDHEKCLMTVIGKHCFGKLSVARDRLQVLAAEKGTGAALETEMPASEDVSPEDCMLNLLLPAMRKPLSVRVEPVTGQFSISPPSNATLNSERILNTDPGVDVARLLAALVCAVVQEPIHKQAELLDWQEIRNLASVKQKFGQDVWQRTAFIIPGWGQQWALAVSSGLGGERWWVVQFKESQSSERSTSVLKEVTTACELPVKESLGEQSAADLDRATLLEIERLAEAEVSYAVLSQQLRSMRIPHRREKPLLNTNDVFGGGRQQGSGAVYLQFSALMRDVRDKTWKPWAADFMRLSHLGIEDPNDCNGERAHVRHELRLTLEAGQMTHLQQQIAGSRNNDMVTNSSSGLALRLRTTFGEPFVEQIRTRLRNVERLDRCVKILQRLQYRLGSVSMANLAFTYRAAAPALGAQLRFSSDGSLPVKLKLEPADSNPHQRIRIMLEQGLNNGRGDSFPLFAQIFTLTLPALQALEALESAHMAQRTAVVRVRGVTWYSLTYRAPLPACTFTVRARSKRQANKTLLRWHVVEAKDKADGAAASGDLAKALKAFWSENGEGWFGIGNGAIADTTGIALVLQKLDEVVRRPEGSTAGSAQSAVSAPSVPVSNVQPQKQEPQKKPTAPTKPTKAPRKKSGPDYITLD